MVICLVIFLPVLIIKVFAAEIPPDFRGSNITNPACYFITPVTQVVAQGSHVTMSIGVGGDPFPQATSIDWVKDGGGAIPAPTNNKQTILLKGIKTVNEGRYLVYVSTRVGTKIIDTEIHVRPTRMSVDVIPKTSKVLQGTSKEIQCSAGEIGSQYMWLRNGRQIEGDDRFSSYTTIDKSTLTISRIKMEDEGSYECRAWTTTQAGNNTAMLQVQDAGKIPTVYISPVNETMFMQDSFDVKMRCSIPNDPKAEFLYWAKDGKQIYGGDARREYEPSRSKLNIFDLRVEDTGRYTCVATLHNGVRVENSTFLTVKPAITITCTEDQFLELGSHASIACTVSGDTQPAVFMAWMKSATTLENSGKYSISEEKSELQISDIDESDGGTYIVVVQTSLGVRHQASSITVIISAKILDSPAGLTVATGSDVSFSCTFSGTPIPYFFWNKDDEAVDKDSDARISTTTSIVDKTTRHNVLTVRGVTKLDAGVYTGIAYNMGNLAQGGSLSNPATLEIIDPPTITIPPQNISLTQGKSTSIKCGFTGDQPLSVEWLYEGRPLSSTDRIALDSGTVKFATTISDDTGSYTCRIQNRVGVVQATARLTVLVPPEITEAPRPVNVTHGMSVRLTCEATVGYPPPVISWRRNGNLLLRDEFHETSDVLEVENIASTDIYTCLASNQAGTDSAQAKVAVKTVPDKPGLPIAVGKDKNSIMLHWEPGHDGYAPIHQYTVMYKVEGGSWQTYPTTAMSNELQITNLQPFKTYLFKVYSANEIGSSEASIEARISTEQGVPTAPLNLLVRPLTSTSAEVSWNQPLDTQGNLYGYDLDYQVRSSQNKEEKVRTTALTYTLNGLDKFTEYSVRVQARNAQGAGDSSQMVFFTTLEDTPGAPHSLSVAAVTSSSLRINWVQPHSPNGIIQFYKVYFQCTSSDCPLLFKKVETRSENPTYLLTDLHKYTEYMIYVTAVTGAGEGASSSNGVGYTLQDRPDGPPQGVAGEPIDSTSITISWAPPNKINQCGVITKYKILYKSLYAPAEPPIDVSTITQYMLRNLTKYTAYSIQIQAGTMKGFGPPSDPIVIRTGEDMPEGRPVEVETNAWSSTEINIVWRPPPQSTVHGEITGYQIEYSRPGGRMLYMETPADRLTALLGDLEKGKNYNICVKVQNSRGSGPCASSQQYTSPDLPSSPFIIKLTPSQTTIDMHWKEPETPNGEITGYMILYTTHSASRYPTWNTHPNITVGAARLTHQITNLQPYTEYLVKVAARTSAGYGNFSAFQDPVRTLESKPASSITNLEGRPLNTTTIELTWSNPIKPNGEIIRYAFSFIPTDGSSAYNNHVAQASSARIDTDTFKTTFSGLEENTLYHVKGMAFNKMGESNWCDPIAVKTSIGAPGNVQAVPVTENSLYLSWENPQGIEEEQNYGYVIVMTGGGEKTETKVEKSVVSLVEGLTPGTQYTIKIKAEITVTADHVVEGPWCAPFSVDFPQQVDSPINVADVSPDVSKVGVIAVNLSSIIPAIFQKSGNSFGVLLVDATSNAVEIADRRKRYTQDTSLIYSTDSITDEEIELTDPRLESGGTFSLRFEVSGPAGVLFTSDPTPPFTVQAMFDPNTTEEQVKAGAVNPLLFLFGIIPIALILIIVAVVCIVRKQRMRKQYPRKQECEPMLSTQLPLEKCEPYYTTSCHPSISLTGLPNIYDTLASNDYEGLIKEFESIDMCSMYTYNHGNAPENAMKNRISDILPYDYNRVKLESGGGGSDYINASYIDGYATKKAYIATQGPIAETFASFWRMIWEQRTATVVMVTRLVEDQHILKCHQYWPNRGTQQRFGDLTVSALDEVSLPDFSVRKFSLQQHSQLREVIQFQFTAWPDHGVPTYATATLAFLRKVQLTNPEHAGPIVVHCSAGVGRTGTFIVIDTMLRRIAKERDVDVYGCVSLLRSQRMQMVQTWEQYKFIYTALLEAIHCGNTEMRPSDISNRLESMSVIDSDNNSCGMEIEFKRLTIHYKYSPNLFTSANLPVNHSKNRYANVLPFESTRVRLQPIAGREGSDYINASYITGYQRRAAYIATQGPLEETVLDFWRMIWEQSVNTIVMLTQIVECGRPGLSKCQEYWPNDKPLVLSLFIISHRHTNETHSFTRRELVITNTATQEERVVQQFHFDTWPEQGLPQSSAILGLVYQLQNNQRMQEHSPVVVHCSAGGGRTGVFIAISTAIERYLQEKLIDIFDLVKNLRNQRPAMVQTLEQYRFIYQVMAEYVESQVDSMGYY